MITKIYGFLLLIFLDTAVSELDTYTSTDIDADKCVATCAHMHTNTQIMLSRDPYDKTAHGRLCHRPQIQPPFTKNLPCSGCSARCWGTRINLLG